MPLERRTLCNQRLWVSVALVLAALALIAALVSRAYPLPEALLRGTRWALVGALVIYALLRRSLLIYGLGGVIVPFVGIKVVDMVLSVVGLT